MSVCLSAHVCWNSWNWSPDISRDCSVRSAGLKDCGVRLETAIPHSVLVLYLRQVVEEWWYAVAILELTDEFLLINQNISSPRSSTSRSCVMFVAKHFESHFTLTITVYSTYCTGVLINKSTLQYEVPNHHEYSAVLVRQISF